MKKLLFILLALISISGLVFSSCAQSSPATTPAATSAAKPVTTTATTAAPQYGGVLKIISTPGITSLGYPGKATFAGEQLLERPAIQYLLTRDINNPLLHVGELATSYEFSADYLAITLKLRQGVKFHDGTPFNAEAAVYNLEMCKKGVRPDFQYVTSFDIIDNYTIRLNFSKYDAGILDNLCSMSGSMVSPTYLKSLGKDDEFKPVGTGPYKFVSYQRDVSLKFIRFDDYWGGKPYLDGLEWIFVADPMTQQSSFKAGEADVVRQLDITGALDIQAAGKYNLFKYPQQIWGIAGDGGHADSIYSDIRIRRAISYAIDTEAIAKAIGKGYYASTNQWDKKDGVFYNPSIAGYPYNPQKAKDLLTEAGYANGFSTKIVLPSAVPTPDMMAMVQNYLNAVGIKTTLDVADPSKFNQLAKDGWNNQLTFFYIAAGFGTADPFKSKMTTKATAFNIKSLLLPDDYIAKYTEAASEPDFAKSVAKFQEMLKLATDQYCIATPILVNYYFKASTQKVHDCDMLEYGINEWRPERAWLSK